MSASIASYIEASNKIDAEYATRFAVEIAHCVPAQKMRDDAVLFFRSHVWLCLEHGIDPTHWNGCLRTAERVGK